MTKCELEMSSSPDANLSSLLAVVQSMLLEARAPPSTDDDVDETENIARLHALRAAFDVHWKAVHDAAIAIDDTGTRSSSTTQRPQSACASEAMPALQYERDTLRSALEQRNRTLKVQIDQLRSALCSMNVMEPTP